MDSSSGKELPPGSRGIPLIGETLVFVKNPFRFIEQRLSKHGAIFRTNLLGRSTVVVAGPDATTQFIDDTRVMREGSMPANIQQIFGGQSLPLLDGDAHRARKGIVLQGFGRKALEAYLPTMQAIVERYFAQWSAKAEIGWQDEMKRLSIEVICTTVIGMQAGPEMDRIRDDYGLITDGFTALPFNLPGTGFYKALKARDRILECFRQRVKARRANPADDGLSRILAAKAADGSMISDEDAVLELHHIVIAGYIVFAEFAATVQQLTQHPDIRARLTEEVRRLAPTGALTLELLGGMPYLSQVVMEVKRISPIVPAVFGKAKTAFQIGGSTVPAGWMVMWALLPTHTTHSVYTNPERFDPDRFSPERAEDKRHEHAFVPQGAGPAMGHRCPGLDFATCFMQVFAVVLLRSYSWTLPDQNLDFNWAKTPPELIDGLRATVRKSP